MTTRHFGFDGSDTSDLGLLPRRFDLFASETLERLGRLADAMTRLADSLERRYSAVESRIDLLEHRVRYLERTMSVDRPPLGGDTPTQPKGTDP